MIVRRQLSWVNNMYFKALSVLHILLKNLCNIELICPQPCTACCTVKSIKYNAATERSKKVHWWCPRGSLLVGLQEEEWKECVCSGHWPSKQKSCFRLACQRLKPRFISLLNSWRIKSFIMIVLWLNSFITAAESPTYGIYFHIIKLASMCSDFPLINYYLNSSRYM